MSKRTNTTKRVSRPVAKSKATGRARGGSQTPPATTPVVATSSAPATFERVNLWVFLEHSAEACRQRACTRAADVASPTDSPVPAEPPELRLWSILTDYRRDLLNTLQQIDEHGPRWTREAARDMQSRAETTWTELEISSFPTSMPLALERTRQDCLAAVAELDRQIAQRPRYAAPPKEILAWLRHGRLRKTVEVVRDYVAAQRDADSAHAWGAVEYFANVPRPLDRQHIDQLIIEGRECLKGKGRFPTRVEIARFVVATLLDLPLGSKELRW